MSRYLTISKNTAILIVFSVAIILNACSNNSNSKTITVPNSDTTPPTVSMSVDFTTSRGQRMTIELNQDSPDESIDLDPMEPIAVLASGKDTDGGIMGVTIVFHVFDICAGSVLGTDIGTGPGNIPQTGGPGDTALKLKLDSFTFNPLVRCPSGNSNASGSISAYAQNFHGGSAQTASFIFKYK